jgi:hypothetical protein
MTGDCVHRATVSYPQGSRGCPQVIHSVVHRFGALPVDNFAEKPQNFFSERRTELAKLDKESVHRVFHRLFSNYEP